MEAGIAYGLFHPDFVASLTGPDLFYLNIMALSEYGKREKERLEEQQKEREQERIDAREKPGLVRRVSKEEAIKRYQEKMAKV